jgi:hypothetical protein
MNAPLRDFQSDSDIAVLWGSQRLWSLWDIMNRLNAANIGRAFAQMLQLSERASNEPSDDPAHENLRSFAFEAVQSALRAVEPLGLVESRDAINRFHEALEESPKMENKVVQLGMHNLAQLVQSELKKLHAFALEREKEKYFRDESWGVEISPAPKGLGRPSPLFSLPAQKGFPSAGMDIVEAGRCLALGRNNAAIYHLMQVAEVGLRVLAWDRRVAILRHKGKTVIPLDFAQWGEILGELEKKKTLINAWKRGKALREEAIQYYTSVIFEVASFNEIYRKHISHARGKLYEDDTALSCWGHVYRFMDKLAERMSEDERTKLVWKINKPITPLEEFLR